MEMKTLADHHSSISSHCGANPPNISPDQAPQSHLKVSYNTAPAGMHQHSRSVKLRVYSDLIPESRHGGLCNVISDIYMVLAFPAAIHAGLLALELHFIVIWKR